MLTCLTQISQLFFEAILALFVARESTIILLQNYAIHLLTRQQKAVKMAD